MFRWRLWIFLLPVCIGLGVWWIAFQRQSLSLDQSKNQLRVVLPGFLIQSQWMKIWQEQARFKAQIQGYGSATDLIRILSGITPDLLIVVSSDAKLVRSISLKPVPEQPDQISPDFLSLVDPAWRLQLLPIGWWIYGVWSQHPDSSSESWSQVLSDSTHALRLPADTCLWSELLKARNISVDLDPESREPDQQNWQTQIQNLVSLVKGTPEPNQSLRRILPHTAKFLNAFKGGDFRIPRDQVRLRLLLAGIPEESQNQDLALNAIKVLLRDVSTQAAIRDSGLFALTTRLNENFPRESADYFRRLPISKIQQSNCQDAELLATEELLSQIGIIMSTSTNKEFEALDR